LEKGHHVEDQGQYEDLIEESIHIHEDKGIVTCTPFQDFDLSDASFDDLESEYFSG
jgi:hypothetical protein